MLTLTAVATTEGGTSLHSPGFVVGLTALFDFVAAAVGDAHKVTSDNAAIDTRPAVAARCRSGGGRRTQADY